MNWKLIFFLKERPKDLFALSRNLFDFQQTNTINTTNVNLITNLPFWKSVERMNIIPQPKKLAKQQNISAVTPAEASGLLFSVEEAVVLTTNQRFLTTTFWTKTFVLVISMTRDRVNILLVHLFGQLTFWRRLRQTTLTQSARTSICTRMDEQQPSDWM